MRFVHPWNLQQQTEKHRNHKWTVHHMTRTQLILKKQITKSLRTPNISRAVSLGCIFCPKCLPAYLALSECFAAGTRAPLHDNASSRILARCGKRVWGSNPRALGASIAAGYDGYVHQWGAMGDMFPWHTLHKRERFLPGEPGKFVFFASYTCSQNFRCTRPAYTIKELFRHFPREKVLNPTR